MQTIKSNEEILEYKSDNEIFVRNKVKKFLDAIDNFEEELKNTQSNNAKSNQNSTRSGRSQSSLIKFRNIQSTTNALAIQSTQSNIKPQDIVIFQGASSKLSSYLENA